MTTTVPDALLADLDALHRRAAADPGIATSASRVKRLSRVVTLVKRAAEDCTPAQLRSLATLLAPDTVGHPAEPDTILGRATTGQYRTHHPGRELTAASQRDLTDGLADLNRAAGHPPYWWQQRGKRPWSKHTRDALDSYGHRVLRRALCIPVEPRREPFRLRALAAVELFWDTGANPEALVRADTTHLAADLSAITLTVNPPGRTQAVTAEFPLSPGAQVALKLWLPVRRRVVAEHLAAGPDHPANQALFITLRTSTGTYPDGSPRFVPPGLRISNAGLEMDYRQWARRLNAEYHGQPGWPVPTTLQQLGRAMANSQPATAVGHWLALQPEDIETATERRAAGESMNAIAASLGVTRQTLGAALRREATRRS
jgi:hypothetical protein